MALTSEFHVRQAQTGTGTTCTATSPNTAAGDVAASDTEIIICSLGLNGTPGGSGVPTITPAAGAMSIIEQFSGALGPGYIWIGIYQCTSAIARNTAYAGSWTTTRGLRNFTVSSYTATETFGGYIAAAARDAGETVGPSQITFGETIWPAAATDLVPLGSTGLGYRVIYQSVDNSAITAGTIATSRHGLSNTAGAYTFAHDIFRTVSTAYATQATGMSGFASRAGIAVHIPTGAAAAAKGIIVPRGRSLQSLLAR